MTQNEIARLAVVETKIDDMLEGQVTLKEFLIEKIDGLEKSLIDKIAAQEKAFNITQAGQKDAINIAMAASEKAIGKAEVANDLKFGEIDRRYNDSMVALNASIKTLTESKDIISGAKTGTTESKVDLTRYLGWIVSILSIGAVLVTLFIR